MDDLATTSASEQAAPRDPLAALLHRSALGDQSAFGLLFDQVAPRVVGLALRMLHDQARAEQLSHDVFVEIWTTSPSFDPARSSALSWMLTMAHQHAVAAKRSASSGDRAIEPPVVLPDAVTPPSDGGNTGTEAVPSATAVEQGHDPLVLAWYEGRTLSEIAELLNVTVHAASHQIAEAVFRIRTVAEGPAM